MSHPESNQRPSGICYLIGRLDHALNRRMREVLSPLGLTVSQYTTLSFLETQIQISNAQLAERALISPQSANEIIKQMHTRGWVEREPDPTHGRIVRLSLTDNGYALLEQAHAAVAALETAMLRELGKPQREAMHNGLRQSLHTLGAMLIDSGLS